MTPGGELDMRLAGPGDAAEMLPVIHAAFGARRAAGEPPAAMGESADSLQSAMRRGGAVLATVDDAIVGCVVMQLVGGVGERTELRLSRVAVAPDHQGRGIATAMVQAACEYGADEGARSVQLLARTDFPELAGWWQRHGFAAEQSRPGISGQHCVCLTAELPVSVTVPTAADMQTLGRLLAAHLQAGDLLVANGELGAGKTTLTQGLGQGLDVEGPVISPTFVLARNHHARGKGPDLVHVDAYRMGSAAELEDIDLDSSMADSVTLVEWGEGLAEGLADDRLDIDIVRSADPADDARVVYLRGHGARWAEADLFALRGQLEQASREAATMNPASAGEGA